MVIKDEPDFIPRRVLLIQHVQEPYEIRTLVGRAYERECLSGKQVDGGQQRQRAQTDIFIITTYCTVIARVRDRRTILPLNPSPVSPVFHHTTKYVRVSLQKVSASRLH